MLVQVTNVVTKMNHLQSADVRDPFGEERVRADNSSDQHTLLRFKATAACQLSVATEILIFRAICFLMRADGGKKVFSSSIKSK